MMQLLPLSAALCFGFTDFYLNIEAWWKAMTHALNCFSCLATVSAYDFSFEWRNILDMMKYLQGVNNQDADTKKKCSFLSSIR